MNQSIDLTIDEKRCLQAIELRKSFKGITAVDKISINVHRGEIVGILGPNGAGKTTLMGLITGISKPDRGEIKLNGRDITNLPVYARAQLGLNYLPQEPSIFRGLSVEDNVLIALEHSVKDSKSRDKALELILSVFDLLGARKQIAAKLSGGLRRRCEIARALATRPRYLLLDEPFSGVDPLAIADLKKTISQVRAGGVGVLISDHNVRETLSIVDRAYVIVGGTILAQGTSVSIAENKLVRDHYIGNSLD